MTRCVTNRRASAQKTSLRACSVAWCSITKRPRHDRRRRNRCAAGSFCRPCSLLSFFFPSFFPFFFPPPDGVLYRFRRRRAVTNNRVTIDPVGARSCTAARFCYIPVSVCLLRSPRPSLFYQQSNNFFVVACVRVLLLFYFIFLFLVLSRRRSPAPPLRVYPCAETLSMLSPPRPSRRRLRSPGMYSRYYSVRRPARHGTARHRCRKRVMHLEICEAAGLLIAVPSTAMIVLWRNVFAGHVR